MTIRTTPDESGGDCLPISDLVTSDLQLPACRLFRYLVKKGEQACRVCLSSRPRSCVLLFYVLPVGYVPGKPPSLLADSRSQISDMTFFAGYFLRRNSKICICTSRQFLQGTSQVVLICRALIRSKILFEIVYITLCTTASLWRIQFQTVDFDGTFGCMNKSI